MEKKTNNMVKNMKNMKNKLTFSQYQKSAWSTAIYPNKGNNIIYPTLGLAGETGEICEKIKKIIRDDNGKVSQENKLLLTKELGDVLWYISALSKELSLSLNNVAKTNIIKLKDRQKRNKLRGSGDNR